MIAGIHLREHPQLDFRLPGAEYGGEQPDGFMPRGAIVASFEGYIERFHLPIQYGTQVVSVEKKEGSKRFLVRSLDAEWEARNVVIATGIFQQPKVPACSADLDSGIFQVTSGKYRNPGHYLPGEVLIVGSGQSGCQIAEELYQSGRKVYLCVGSAGQGAAPYRGRDIVEWYHLSGYFDRTGGPADLTAAKYRRNPHVTGKDGGHNLNLHQFARDGVTLLGHIRTAHEHTVWTTQT